MKKIVKIIAATIFALTLFMNASVLTNDVNDNSTSVFTPTEALAKAGGDDMRWAQLSCAGGGTYEICFYSGDGNTCSPWGSTTRDCPSEQQQF